LFTEQIDIDSGCGPEPGKDLENERSLAVSPVGIQKHILSAFNVFLEIPLFLLPVAECRMKKIPW